MDNSGSEPPTEHRLLGVLSPVLPATEPRGRSSSRRLPRASDLAVALLSTALVARFALPQLWQVPTVQAWTLVFGAVCVQAVPYVVLGVLLSVVLTVAPTGWLRRALPRREVFAVPVAAAFGTALPGCECGSVPLAASLVRRGISVGPAVSLMLSAPATNPVVLAATAAAFPARPGVVLARFLASLAVAIGVGWCLTRSDISRRSTGAGSSSTGARCMHEHRPAAGHVLETSVRDLAQSLGLLTLGAASAATVAVLVPPAALAVFGRSAIGGILVLALLAIVLAVCSEADAFIASSLTSFSITAQLVFMVVGPVVDVKLIAMQAGAFGGRFAARLGCLAFTAAVGCAVLAAWGFA